MRSDQEMLDLILNTAKDDDRIRAVIMNGSRVNPNAPTDIFQDFDIIYIVTEVEFYKSNYTWIKRFGELMILQLPDGMGTPLSEEFEQFTYLMQFKDGNRIDLTIVSISKYHEFIKDSLSLLLLDKDEIIEPFPPPNDTSYLPKPPTTKDFFECCNEFWWVCPYVAKGLWRQEITYAKSMLDEAGREQLMKMITWYIGVKTQFIKNPGKKGKYFNKYLEPDHWEMLLRTYANANIEQTWQALLTMCDLFRITAVQVANYFGFEYPKEDDENVTAHLKHVRELPVTAKKIY
jgi:aminoglycoside 6-adenylyltransferase